MTGLNHVICLAQLTRFSLTWPSIRQCSSSQRLLLKLKSNGIDSCLHAWLRHFLTGLRQRVILRGTRSNWSSVTSGTPQGTILGPLLFLIYINDITNCVSSTVKLYADDTKIYRQIVDPIKDPQLLQIDLSNLMEWARKWQLRLNDNSYTR